MDSSPSNSVADRTRFLACAMAVVCLAGWISWFWPFDDLLDRQGTPLGADFSMFFTAGQIASDGEFAKLYDQAEHQRRLHESFPGLDAQFCLPFRYPPAVALVLAPLSRLPYAAAWGAFSIASCLAYAGSLYLLAKCPLPPFWRTRETSELLQLPKWSQRTFLTAVWACVGWPVAWEVLIGGQASMFALAIVVVAIALISNQRLVLAGAVLALSAYKPNVLVWFAVGIALRHPRVVLGAVPVLGAMAGFSCLAGRERLGEYLQLALDLTSGAWDIETPFWKAHSFASCFELVMPGHGRSATILIGLLASAMISIVWRREDAKGSTWSQPFSLAGLLVVNALLNPYTPIYDLVLLAPAGWLVLKGFSSAPAKENSPVSAAFVQCWLAVLFFGPHLSQALARPLGLQLFPFALAAVGVAVLTTKSHQRVCRTIVSIVPPPAGP